MQITLQMYLIVLPMVFLAAAMDAIARSSAISAHSSRFFICRSPLFRIACICYMLSIFHLIITDEQAA